ncbi:MAG: hypothetical protein ABIH92_01280 [Nanoarchaeota archaeon]
MKTERKILVMGRHGVKQRGKGRDNLLTPTSIARLYAAGASLRDIVAAYNISPEGTFLRHSKEARTLRTGKALLTGAFNRQVPQTNKQLDELDLDGTDVRFDPRLCYGIIGEDFKFDLPAYLRDGEHTYMVNWVANPDARQYPNGSDAEITSFNDVVRTSRACLVDNLGYILDSGNAKKLGVLATHGGIVEGLAVAAINSARDQAPVERLDEIGGEFQPEDSARLVIDYKPRSGSATAELIRGDQSYAVNINLLGGVRTCTQT